MRHALLLAVTVSAAALVPTAPGAPSGVAPARPVIADDKHKEGDHGEEHKGEKKDLGKQDIAGYSVHATQVGDVKPGEEAIFILALSGGSGKPKAVRGWVGVESGERSVKSRAEDEGKEYHLHHPVSKPLPPKSRLWVEIETAAGRKRASFTHK